MTDKKEEIYRCAKELFSQKGFKYTNVTDITNMAGIAAGTFYIYYTSKDELFMDLFNEENVKLKKHIMEAININGDPIEVSKQMMLLNYQGINSNPILKEWYNKDVFSKIEQKYREKNGEQINFMYYAFIDIVKKWQKDGKMRDDIDPETIMAIFAAIANIDSHKDEIGLQYFPRIINYISDFVMTGLTLKNSNDML